MFTFYLSILPLTCNLLFLPTPAVACVCSVLGMQPPLPPEAVRELVSSCLHRDPVAADLRCSLFVAAAQSYKRDSLLRPFPPRYISADVKDFEGLVRARDTIKKLYSGWYTVDVRNHNLWDLFSDGNPVKRKSRRLFQFIYKRSPVTHDSTIKRHLVAVMCC